jgi:hypothetical protein
MSPQEMQVLENFLNQLTQARVEAKDAQAETLIAAAVAKQPDAAYLLVQRALLLDQALGSAKAQISSLQNELQAARASGAGAGSPGFLDSNAWGNASTSRPASMPPSAAQTMSQATQAVSPQPAATPRSGFLGGFGSTLGNIATTAAGVAGGALLFQGIENLFHHNSGNGFLGQSAIGPMAAAPAETTIINNYYERDIPQDDLRDTGSDGDFTDADWSGDDVVDDTSFV